MREKTLPHAQRMRRFLVGIAVFVLALGLAGVATAGVSHQAVIAKVTVTFTDSTLRVSTGTRESGMTTFVVLNKGKKRHVLAIEGPGLKGVQTSKLLAGGEATLTVKLRPGSYVLSDPVGLGVYTVQFLSVVPASTVSGKGNSNVVAPAVEPPPMCGQYYTP
jgi:hypothetical protein